MVKKDTKKKDQSTAWLVKVDYKIPETGKWKIYWKRGFQYKKDAEAHEAEIRKLIKETGSPYTEMTSTTTVTATKPKERTFYDVYTEYVETLSDRDFKEDTAETKLNMLEKHVLPFFKDYALSEITPKIVKMWQDETKKKKSKNGKPFSQTYLHSIQSQLNVVLNYSVRKAYIPFSPMVDLKNMGKKDADAKPIWSPDDYKKFAEVAKNNEQSFVIFEMCYWLGLRRGEALALTPNDITYNQDGNMIIYITQSTNAKHKTGDVKTTGSKRSLQVPKTVADELKTYMDKQYELKPTQPIFDISVSQLHREKNEAIERAGVTKIRIHDMRHSAASLLIHSQKYSVTDVARYLGHSSAKTTLKTYAHMLPETLADIALTLDEIRNK